MCFLKITYKFVPFCAVAMANVCNIGLMRRGELVNGIDIKDKDGNVLGKSVKAGRAAVAQTIISRVLLCVPLLVLPPAIMAPLENSAALKEALKKPLYNNSLNVALVAATCLLAVPWCIGLFPQFASMDVKKVEPKFHNLKDKDGNPITRVYYNKGL
jgi:hypothetical protein